MKINPKTDTAFYGTCSAGDVDCKCSRCRKQINELETPLRLWVNGEETEYRYCEACQKEAGVPVNSIQSQSYPVE